MGKAIATLQAGEERPFPASGNYLQVIKTSQLLEVELVQNNEAYETHLLKQGGGVSGKKFSSIVVKNEGTAATDIYIATGVGEYQPSQNDANVTIDTSAGSVPVTLDETQLNLQVNQQTTGATNLGLPHVTLAEGETKKFCEVNALRKYISYNILSSSSCEYVHIGGSGVDSTSGKALERGMLMADETTGELWAHNPVGSGGAATIFPMEVTG